MTDGRFIHEDQSQTAEQKLCPLLKRSCLGEQCQWWVADFMEDKRAYRMDCAISLIAKAVTDETLLRLAGK